MRLRIMPADPTLWLEMEEVAESRIKRGLGGEGEEGHAVERRAIMERLKGMMELWWPWTGRARALILSRWRMVGENGFGGAKGGDLCHRRTAGLGCGSNGEGGQQAVFLHDDLSPPDD